MEDQILSGAAPPKETDVQMSDQSDLMDQLEQQFDPNRSKITMNRGTTSSNKH